MQFIDTLIILKNTQDQTNFIPYLSEWKCQQLIRHYKKSLSRLTDKDKAVLISVFLHDLTAVWLSRVQCVAFPCKSFVSCFFKKLYDKGKGVFDMEWTGLFDSFQSHQDLDKAKPMAQYMRNQFEFIGIRTPERRQLSKPYLTQAKKELKDLSKDKGLLSVSVDWEFVERCWQASEREFQLLATDYLTEVKAYLKPTDLSQFESILIRKSWWDSVDSLVKTIGYLVQQYPALTNVMLEWSVSENIWLRRVAILHQLGLKQATRTDMLHEIIENNFGESEFFINKAIGWALRDYARTNPEWVKAFVSQYQPQLSGLSRREAMKHLTND